MVRWKNLLWSQFGNFHWLLITLDKGVGCPSLGICFSFSSFVHIDSLMFIQKIATFKLNRLTKGIGVSIAWYIQSVISAFTSALEGGLIVSRTLMRIGRKRGFNFIPPENETVIDEISSYVIAGLGFFFQVRLGFQVPYPLNLILWPFGLAETWIRWSITKVA